MIYPEFIKENDTLGICAPSAGLGDRLDCLKVAKTIFEAEGYKVKITKSCKNKGSRSANAKVRAQEFDELIKDKNVKLINFATGGDYGYEILPYLNLENIKRNPKWLSGLSDPTNLTYLVTTNLDIATLYGHNACSFDVNIENSKDVALDYYKGIIKPQKSYKAYYDFIDTIKNNFDNPKPVKWLSKDVNFSGRCIGGCFEVIAVHLGTPYDKTNEFIDKYKDDGIVWYFDVFNTPTLFFYLQLTQMKHAGYFRHCKGVILGRIAFENKDCDTTYTKAIKKVLGKIPVITEADVGHTKPGMTMINGAIISVECKDNKGKISFKLK